MIKAQVVDERMSQVGTGFQDFQPLLDPLYDEHLKRADFPMLQCVDDYGNTYFNKFQAKFVLEELHRIEPHLPASHMPTFHKVVRMAEQVRDGTHLYLRLQGD